MESDALRSVRNAYYLGLFNEVNKEVANIDRHNAEAIGHTRTRTRMHACLPSAVVSAGRVSPRRRRPADASVSGIKPSGPCMLRGLRSRRERRSIHLPMRRPRSKR